MADVSLVLADGDARAVDQTGSVMLEACAPCRAAVYGHFHRPVCAGVVCH